MIGGMIASGIMSDKLSVVAVIGPTASGKSGRAIALAKERGGEVISVDSRQVYRGLDIGTEKIPAREMQGIPHHLIDIRNPQESYSAGDFVADAARLIKDIAGRGKLPILAGGTHFYYDALLNGLPAGTPSDPALRAELEQLSDGALMEEIGRADPERAAAIDRKNRRRLVRALEIIRNQGHVPARMKNDAYDVEWVVLAPLREELRARIRTRLAEALEKGLVEEVRHVRAAVGDERLDELGLEYRIVGEYLRGERSEESLLPALEAKLFQYARRQEAWIRKLTS